MSKAIKRAGQFFWDYGVKAAWPYFLAVSITVGGFIAYDNKDVLVEKYNTVVPEEYQIPANYDG